MDIEKQHILPFHDGGSKLSLTVYCSSANHTFAHYYRYLAYGQKGDLVAFTMRRNPCGPTAGKGQKMEIKERVALSIQKNQQLEGEC